MANVFTLGALGAFPEGPAYKDAIDLVTALAEAGQSVVVQTSLSPRALALAKEWMVAQGFPAEGVELLARDDDFPTEAAMMPDHLGRWLKGWASGQKNVTLYGGSMEELEACAEVLGGEASKILFHQITPQAIYRIVS